MCNEILAELTGDASSHQKRTREMAEEGGRVLSGKREMTVRLLRRPPGLFHVEALLIYKLGFNQNNYTFALISPIKVVLCSKFH